MATANSTLNWHIHRKPQTSEQFVPLVMSWNVTRECNMKCSHCYINATEKKLENELTTEEAKKLMDQICQVSKPLLILSGGEPLLRPDIYELIEYGTSKGLKMGFGSNGSLIDDDVAAKLKAAGIATVSISLGLPYSSATRRVQRRSWRMGKSSQRLQSPKKKQCARPSKHNLNPSELQSNRRHHVVGRGHRR